MHKPLNGLTVAITSSRRASELSHLVEALGAKAYVAPTIGIQTSKNKATGELKRFLELSGKYGGFDVAVFMTGPGTHSIMSAGRELGVEEMLLQCLKEIPLIIARSSKPRAVLEKYGVNENVKISPEPTASGVVGFLRTKKLEGCKIAIFWHGSRHERVVEFLGTAGAEVLEFATYSYSNMLNHEGTRLLESSGFAGIVAPDKLRVSRLIDDLIEGKIDAITFTSPPSVENLFLVAKEESKMGELRDALDLHVIVSSIGPSTSEKLLSYGVTPDSVPEVYKMGKMVESLVEYVKSGSKVRAV